jgi:hypothetical protein
MDHPTVLRRVRGRDRRHPRGPVVGIRPHRRQTCGGDVVKNWSDKAAWRFADIVGVITGAAIVGGAWVIVASFQAGVWS